MFLGVDIGSTSSKAVIVNDAGKVCSNVVINKGTGSDGSEMVVKKILDNLNASEEDIKFTVVTGYGRMTYGKADKQITEISCHGRGARSIVSGAKTIIDIGGQDAKVIKLSDEGKVINFVMNEKCAAGTGRFMEVMANVLGCSLDELSELAEKSTEDIQISSTCAVFAESEVISQLSVGKAREDVAKGIHDAIAKRIVGLANRIGITSEVVMTGGLAMNKSLVKALEDILKVKITIANSPQTVGALGASLYALELYKEGE